MQIYWNTVPFAYWEMSALWSVLSTHTDTGSWHCGFEDFPFVFTASSWEGERKRKGKEEDVSRPRVCVGRPRESVPPNTQMAGKIHLLLTGSLADFYSVWVGERAGAERRMQESRACKCTYVCTRKRERMACSELRGFYLHVQSDRAAQGRGAELWQYPSGTEIQTPNKPFLCPLLRRGTQEASSSWYLARYVTGKFLSPKIPWNGLWKLKNCLSWAKLSLHPLRWHSSCASQGSHSVTSCSWPWGCASTYTSFPSEFLALGRNEPVEIFQNYFSELSHIC